MNATSTVPATSTKVTLLYWLSTILIALNWTFGGLSSLLRANMSMEVFRRLGYPVYFSSLLGVAQLLGVIAILAPVPTRVREWAYAGLTFDVISAIVSLLAIGSPVQHLGFPIFALVMLIMSYTTWHRRLARAE